MRNLILCCGLLVFIACNNEYIPKPVGYYRIDFPKKNYSIYSNDSCECPFTFEYPDYSVVSKDKQSLSEPCWLNIDFPIFKARIYLSYKKVNSNVKDYIEDARMFAYKHTIKAMAINEKILVNDTNHVYGIMYFIEGDAASSTQFYLTDTTNHFLRGALYFNVAPNSDSLAPVISFIREDIEHFLHSLKWESLEEK